MKKLILLSLFLAAIMTACYDEYKTDYVYTGAYFSYQHPARTVIMEDDQENFEIKVGAVYGGRYSYGGVTETVNFTIDESLITDNTEYTDKGIQVMPSSWYTLSSESEINLVNENVGYVTVTIDREALVSNPEASQNTYAIPFKMTEATTDSILEGKDYSIVVVKFKNQWDGRYYIKGSDKTLDATGTEISEMVYSNDALVLNSYVYLNTTARDVVTVARIGAQEDGNKYTYQMQVRESDGTGIITAADGSDITLVAGGSNYDYANNRFICKYNYTMDGVEHSVTDTLIYSNTEIVLEDWMD
ncbi:MULTISPECIES: DUF1735 domain-containing protein [unclassified Saccharicrinis]|uniref:DUF1735 domain-containing protein n=1 Tax=unclassified Saccharicrinis TaxID=2646859 RepID=UPI003D343F0D